jgi:ketosteroid isomerase-like protein
VIKPSRSVTANTAPYWLATGTVSRLKKRDNRPDDCASNAYYFNCRAKVLYKFLNNLHMRKYLIVFAILILGACYRNKNNPMDVSEIHRWIDNYEEAIRTADIEAILSGSSNNIVYFPPNQPAFSGKENLRKWLLAYFNYYNPSEVLLAQDIKVRGNIAYVSCNYIVAARVKDSIEEFKDTGKLIILFEPGSNGKWICRYFIWNSNNRSIDLHAQIPADFSGTWKLDLSKSTDFPNLISSKILLVQKGNEITINRSYELKNQKPVTNSFKYSIGHEQKSVTKSGSTTTTSFWSSDKQSFTIIETFLSSTNNIKHEYKRTSIYSITIKGEVLNVISDDILPQGSFTPTNNNHFELTYIRQ